MDGCNRNRIHPSDPSPRSWTGTIDRVSRPAIDCRRIRVLANGDLCSRRSEVPGRILDLERDGINAAIAAAVTFSPQLGRLTGGPDDDVIQSIAVTIAVFGFITGDLQDVDAVQIY